MSEEFQVLTIEERRGLARQAEGLFNLPAFRLAVLEAEERIVAAWKATKPEQLGMREKLHDELRGLRDVIVRLTALADERRVDPEGE